jgi:hypothetical protein
MSAAERECRSRLAQITHEQPLLHGTLTVRLVRCGKPNCHCASAEPHRALYLTYRRQGRPHQLYIPASLEAQARQWVANDQTVRQLLERVNALTLQAFERSKRR